MAWRAVVIPKKAPTVAPITPKAAAAIATTLDPLCACTFAGWSGNELIAMRATATIATSAIVATTAAGAQVAPRVHPATRVLLRAASPGGRGNGSLARVTALVDGALCGLYSEVSPDNGTDYTKGGGCDRHDVL
jgi:hypothetical protein